MQLDGVVHGACICEKNPLAEFSLLRELNYTKPYIYLWTFSGKCDSGISLSEQFASQNSYTLIDKRG